MGSCSKNSHKETRRYSMMAVFNSFFLFLGIILLFTHCQAVQCPPGAKPFGSKCYRFVKQSLNWNDARTLCKALHPGGRLATIDSEAENNFVFGLMSGNMAWIGLNDVATEGKMVWADREGTPTYFNWNYNQPDNSGGIEDCVHILAISAPPKQWNDYPCDRKQPFVCEFPSEHSSAVNPPTNPAACEKILDYEREECGSPGISPTECHKKGCCYKTTPADDIKCFLKD